jgi:hypothetical protein
MIPLSGGLGQHDSFDMKPEAPDVPAERLGLAPPVTGRRVSRNQIAQAVRNLGEEFRPGVDAVVSYYSGHGGCDQVDRNDQYCALPTGERLYHADIRAPLDRLNPSLPVILCASAEPRPPASDPIPWRDRIQNAAIGDGPVGAIFVSSSTVTL